MTILVTGGAGFIGSNFVLDWLAQPTSRGQPRRAHLRRQPANLASLQGDARHVFVQGDICDRALVDRLLASTGRAPSCTSPPKATSTAASTARAPSSRPTSKAPSRCWRPRAYWGTLAAGAKAAFRFHHVSTDEVYGSLAPDATGLHRDHPYEPNSPYSASKAASDHLVRAWHHTYGLPVLTTNCSNNYGPYHFPEKLIPLMIVNALAGKPLPVYGDGLQVRDWLYVRDHCSAIRAVLAGGRPGRDLQRRRLEREAQHRHRAHHLRAARRTAPRPRRAPTRA
jgi:dTDP-glucose 4,6-dehydratase